MTSKPQDALPPDPAPELVNHITVVKCCWRRALQPTIKPRKESRVLTDEQFLEVTDTIESWVEAASKMTRRASLLLSYAAARESDSSRIGNLRDARKGFWRDLFRTGCTKGKSGAIYSPNPAIHDAFIDSKEWLDDVSCFVLPDQILSYTAGTYATVVSNSFWVPLLPRIERLVKLLAKEIGTELPRWEIMNAVRGGVVPGNWSDAEKGIAMTIRTQLNAKDTIGPKYGLDCAFSDLFAFYKWMQTEFDRLGAKQMRLIPLTRVKRHHIRLDRKVLESLLFKHVPADDPDMTKLMSIRKGMDPRLDLPPKPKKSEPEYESMMEDFKAASESPEFLKRMEEFKQRLRNPSRDLPKVAQLPKKGTVTNDEYEAAKKLRAVTKKARDAASKADDFVAQKGAHDEYVDLTDRILTSFIHLPKHVLKNRGSFKPSLCTDGVAVSLQFEKLKPRVEQDPRKFLPRLPTKLKHESCTTDQWEEYQLRLKKAKAARSAEERTDEFKESLKRYKAIHENCDARMEPTDTYDRSMNSTVCPELKVAVLGLDPGRTNIASIAMMYIDKEGNARKFKRNFSRKSYYVHSGINKAEQQQKIWHRDLVAKGWKQLAESGAMRTRDADFVLGYIRGCASISAEWWATALKRREARKSFSAYCGKNRCIDRFYSSVKKDAEQVVKQNYGPGYSLQMAFGSAGITMPSTGKGEVSVPTTGSFKACKRTFKETSVTWEWGSTCMSWGGDRREIVYAAPVEDTQGDVVMKLRHTSSNKPPIMTEPDIELMKRYIEKSPQKVQEKLEEHMQREKKPRFPHVRGLRFCTEIRNYLDRDLAAACTIGRLRLMEILKQGRPQPFCPKRQSEASDENPSRLKDGGNPRIPDEVMV
jgi:hypothetical protein